MDITFKRLDVRTGNNYCKRSSEEYQRKIKKWNVLKSRGYIEQAVREYMEYTGSEQNEATEFINNL